MIDSDRDLSAFVKQLDADRFQLVPCDLNVVDALPRLLDERAFSTQLPTVILADDVFQFLNVDAVDSLLRWAAAMPRVALVVCAPTMPLDDVFAVSLTQAMRLRRTDLFLQHWDSVHALQSTLLRHGFVACVASTLQDVWHGVADDERLRIAALEPFDEFEDLAAHASRHSVALACRGVDVASDDLLPAPRSSSASVHALSANDVIYPSSSNTRKQIERWGASLCVLGRTVVVFGGFGGGGGAHARLSSISVASYSPTRECWTWQPLSAAGVAPSARMHHAATTLALHDGTPVAVLLGGRASPPAALADVFVLRVDTSRWLNVELNGKVQARFRHTLTRVADSIAVAIGGRCGERVLGLVFVDVLTLGQAADDSTAVVVQVEAKATLGDAPRARFAHASAFVSHLNAIAVLGGLDALERAVSCDELHLLDVASWTWRTVKLTGAAAPIALFSHSMHVDGSRLWVIGGANHIFCIDTETMQWLPQRYSLRTSNFVLWQHSSALIDDRELLVVGGGFACGQHDHFNSFARVLLDSNASFAMSDSMSHAAASTTMVSPAPPAAPIAADCVQSIDVIDNVTTTQFESIVSRKTPAIFRNADFGRARELWTAEHLKANGGSVEVSVHACDSPFLDFQSRNYSFRNMSFGALIDSVYDAGAAPREFLYLRSVGANPRKDVADVWSQWPMLCNDGQLRVPESMAALVTPHLFSSVFRVASAGTWVFTHYDVCDNILIGVRGRKRVVLFAPRDVDRLYVDGSTSRIVDIDSAAQSTTQFPRFRKAYERRYEAVLEQGDILYIPALWFHTTFAIGAPAVGVNMFWRDPALPREFLSTRDLYGNVDPIPAAQLLRELTIEDHGTVKPPSLNSLLRSLEQLPPHYRDFYGRKFVDEIQKRLSLN
jgi:tRNA wybutosine-synthesizing protein 5